MTREHGTVDEHGGRLAAFGEQAFWWTVGALGGGTLSWIVWGVLTPGDYMGQGSFLLPVTVVVVGAAAGWASRRARSRGRGIGWLVWAAICVVFWTCVPDGWWVKPPPRIPRSSPRLEAPKGGS
jgi:hypothetical protein